MEKLVHYIIRASFSQERITYLPEESKIIYGSRDGKEEKAFDALKWLASMGFQVLDRGDQIVVYYGYYSNVSRGKRKKTTEDSLVSTILELDKSSKEYRKN